MVSPARVWRISPTPAGPFCTVPCIRISLEWPVMTAAVAIAYLDGPRLSRALTAGIRHLFLRRDYLNRINVFPVPDGDTGTNLAFTFKSILDALGDHAELALPEAVDIITESALDGARGNSGAIMAQYFQGFREALGQHRLINASGLARASARGAEQAWTAMAEPVAGTLPTVLEDFGAELLRRAEQGTRDIGELLYQGLEAAARRVEALLFQRCRLHEFRIEVAADLCVRVQQEQFAARHAGGQIGTDRAHDHDAAARHVLAGVVAGAFYHGQRSGITHREALAGLAIGEEFAPGGSV